MITSYKHHKSIINPNVYISQPFQFSWQKRHLWWWSNFCLSSSSCGFSISSCARAAWRKRVPLCKIWRVCSICILYTYILCYIYIYVYIYIMYMYIYIYIYTYYIHTTYVYNIYIRWIVYDCVILSSGRSRPGRRSETAPLCLSHNGSTWVCFKNFIP